MKDVDGYYPGRGDYMIEMMNFIDPYWKKNRSGISGTIITLRATLVTVRIIKMKNIILMTVKLLTMDLLLLQGR